jgi:glycerophosphoryl diester phosphodiesterase
MKSARRIIALLIAVVVSLPEMTKAVPTLSGAPPLIIAHRGASGERPEHTLEAYERAIDQGADFIEPDLVLTRDGVLIARHENEISGTTDVATREEFRDRKRTKLIDGESVTGWFTEDFTILEIYSLLTKERLPQLRLDNAKFDLLSRVPSFRAILMLVKAKEKETGRRIGIYPETKHPSYFASIGLPHEFPLLLLLKEFGYTKRTDPIFIQSFEVGNLKALRTKTDVGLIQLVGAQGGPADMPTLKYQDMMKPAGLRQIAAYADGIGPDKAMIIPRLASGALGTPTKLVALAHKAHLAVHPWTFRRENFFLPSDFKSGDDPRGHGDLAAEIRAFVAMGIDGLFSDNPADALAALRPAKMP